MSAMKNIQHIFEAGAVLLTIHWQPIFGIISSACIAVYYVSKLKIDVVDKKYSGKWLKYFKSIIK